MSTYDDAVSNGKMGTAQKMTQKNKTQKEKHKTCDT